MAFTQGGDGGDQLGQAGAQSNEGQRDNGFRHAQFLGDEGTVVNQQVGAHGDDGSADNQQSQLHPEGTLLGFAFFFLNLVGVLHALTDGDEHVHGEDGEQHEAQPLGEFTQEVGGHAVQGGGAEEEDDGHLHGLDVDRAGIASNGDGGNQRSIADDGADGVAVSHSALTLQGTGDRNHDLGQRGTDGNDGRTDDDVRQLEAAGKAGGAVNEPVAALDEQHQTEGKEKNSLQHGNNPQFICFSRGAVRQKKPDTDRRVQAFHHQERTCTALYA